MVNSYEVYAASKEVSGTTISGCVYPFCETFEYGIGAWVSDASWGLTTEDSHGGSYSLTNSPCGDYSNNDNGSTKIKLDLTAESVLFSLSGTVTIWSVMLILDL